MKIYQQLGLLFLLLMALSMGLTAQSNEAMPKRLSPIQIEARVIGILEHHPGLAVIKVIRVDSSNTFNLKNDSEVLVEFVFGTKAVKGEAAAAGVTANDFISCEIYGEFNPQSGQWDYRVFRYFVEMEK